MKLVFGLGNPEEKYNDTRHNIGFFLIDAYADNHEASFQLKGKFRALVAECSVAGEKVLLAKPTTYYNLVGESLHAIMDFYKLTASDILIVHDDLALLFGMVRARVGGTDAGNNGIKSINQHGGDETNRLRIGIGTDMRAIMGDVDFVLGRFTKEELEVIQKSISPKAVEMIDTFLAGEHQPTSHTISHH